jgi:hypothetical protein
VVPKSTTEAQFKVSPGQSKYKLREAQELLGRLQYLFFEAQNPAIETINDALQKAEEMSLQIAHQNDIDPSARKTLEDISYLLLSARQMSRNKGIADKLQRIADESQKAYEANRNSLPGVSASTAVTAGKAAFDWVNTWRPLFYLMTTSRDFRKLLLDSIRIARGISYRYVFTDENTERFKEGEPVQNIAEDIKEDVKQDVQNEDVDMTDEEWNRLQEDIQRVLCLLAKEPSYRQGIEGIFNLLDMFQNTLANLPEEAAKAAPEDVHVRRIALETEELVASFSGREAFERFKFTLIHLITKIQQDENIQSYLSELKDLVLSAKSEEEIRSNEFKEKSKDVAKRGRYVMREIKEEDLNPFLQAADELVENIKNDEFLQVLRQQAGIVQSDLSYVDTEGLVQLDTDMLSKLQKVLLPVLADALKYIPVPRIYSNDHNREFWLDKIVLCSYDIIPENVRFHLESDSEISFKDVELKDTHTKLVIILDRLLTELKDVEFYYKKKTFPELEDTGRVTFRVKGAGAKLRLTYNVVQGPEDKTPRINEGRAFFDISDLEIEFDKKSLKHEVLIPMLGQMFKLQIKTQIEHNVEKNLTNWMNKLGDMIADSVSQTNRPFVSGFEAARKIFKSSDMAKIYKQRKEKLE